MSNVTYSLLPDRKTMQGRLPDGTTFLIDADQYDKVKNINFYCNLRNAPKEKKYISSCRGKYLHRYLVEHIPGYEIDHVNLDTMDNRLANLRRCTHQANQCNQPLQINNTSGAAGVSYYPPRKKYRARIKVAQHDIHLGYYTTFIEAKQARNVGVECMFGEYGRCSDEPPAPDWIRRRVITKCQRFAELSICKAFSCKGKGDVYEACFIP